MLFKAFSSSSTLLAAATLTSFAGAIPANRTMSLFKRQNAADAGSIFETLKGISPGDFNGIKVDDPRVAPPSSSIGPKGVSDDVCTKSPPSNDPNKDKGVTFFCVSLVHFERCEGGKIIKNIVRPNQFNPFNKGCVGGGYCLGKPGQNPCIDLSKDNVANALKGGVFFGTADNNGS